MYIGFDGPGTNHSVYITNTTFIENDCRMGGGGGAFIADFSSDINASPSYVKFMNCSFYENIADFGGAILEQNLQGSRNYVDIERCDFVKNRAISEGSAVVIAALYPAHSRNFGQPTIVTDRYNIICTSIIMHVLYNV